jgi:hypothetical protein
MTNEEPTQKPPTEPIACSKEPTIYLRYKLLITIIIDLKIKY